MCSPLLSAPAAPSFKLFESTIGGVMLFLPSAPWLLLHGASAVYAAFVSTHRELVLPSLLLLLLLPFLVSLPFRIHVAVSPLWPQPLFCHRARFSFLLLPLPSGRTCSIRSRPPSPSEGLSRLVLFPKTSQAGGEKSANLRPFSQLGQSMLLTLWWSPSERAGKALLGLKGGFSTIGLCVHKG